MDRRFLKTEKAIRSAYFTMLLEGKKKITVADLARAADIDRKTFYLHYQSIEDIVVAYAKETAERFLTMLKERDFFSGPADLTKLFTYLNELMLKDLPLYRCLSRDRNYDFFWKTIQALARDVIIDLFIDNEDPEYHNYADYYTCGMIAVYRRWLDTEDTISLDQLSSYLGKISAAALQYQTLPEKTQ